MDHKVFVVDDDTASRDQLKSLVNTVLDLPEYLDGYWDVVDQWPKEGRPQLALAHYNQKYDPVNRLHEPLRHVRGTVVDLDAGVVVADSYGYTQDLKLQAPLRQEEDGSVIVPTTMPQYSMPVERAPEEAPVMEEGEFRLEPRDVRLFLGYEGALVRVFKWHDHVFFSPHRKIDGRKSRWGSAETFYDMYQRFDGPPLESMFGDEETSPFCYMYLVVDDALRIAGSTTKTGLMFVGVKQMWDAERQTETGAPYEHDEDTVLYAPKPSDTLFMQPEVTVDIANKFLYPQRFASKPPTPALENELVVSYDESCKVDDVYYQPYTSLVMGGDFVLMYRLDQDGNTIVYRLTAPAFRYRSKVMGEDPTPYHRFVLDLQAFYRLDADTVIANYPRYAINGHVIPLSNVADRQSYWWNIFMDAVPPSKRGDAESFLSQYTADLKKVANFIYRGYPRIAQRAMDEERNGERGPFTRKLALIPPRIVPRLEALRAKADMGRRRGQSPVRKIESMLVYESGIGLYQMIGAIRKIRKFED